MRYCIKFFFVLIIMLGLIVKSSKAQDEILFRKHVVNSGINGLFYGVALDIIAELNHGAAAGVPVISAGVSAIIPLLANSSKTISYNSLVLSNHGKAIGWAHGFALATLAGGKNAWSGSNYKLSVGLGAATSIGLGILGNSLGKNSGWTDGQVSLYRHYGWIMPFTGISVMAAVSNEPRLYGASVLVFGAAGYFIADKVYKWNQYTRGDIRATQVLSLLNGGLGYGIMVDRVGSNDVTRADLLFPALGLLSGTVASHFWLKNTNLTPKQGTMTSYAATGGAILGLGIALLTESDKPTPYYLIPYVTGLGAYAYAVEKFRRKNEMQGLLPKSGSGQWEFAIMPQNLFLNKKMNDNGLLINGNPARMQPLIAASLTF
jgi:hypothetical protein